MNRREIVAIERDEPTEQDLEDALGQDGGCVGDFDSTDPYARMPA